MSVKSKLPAPSPKGRIGRCTYFSPLGWTCQELCSRTPGPPSPPIKVARFMCHHLEDEDGPPKRPATSSGPQGARTRKRPYPAAIPPPSDDESRESASEDPSPAKRRQHRVFIPKNLVLKYPVVRLSPLKSPRKAAQKLLSAAMKKFFNAKTMLRRS